MLKIGEFARLAQVSVRLLHYYDGLGLLSPATVDRDSGYRYYAADQLPRLHRILALKDLGLSLEEVACLLDEAVSVEELRAMLLLKQAELRRRVAEEQARLDRVEERLRFIEQEGKLPEIEVMIKPVPIVRVLSLRRGVPFGQPPHYVFAEARTALRQHGLRRSVQAVQARYHSRYLMESYGGLQMRRNLFEAAYAVEADERLDGLRDWPTERGGHLRLREWPAVQMMACAVHRGADNRRHLAHHAMLRWMALEGYALDGPQREIYLWRAEPDETSDEHVTEIQHPIRKIER